MGRHPLVLLSAFAFLGLTACGGGEADISSDDMVSPPGEMADGVYPFQGRWANSFTDCALAPGSAEEAPILITPAEFVGYENRCEITSVTVIDEASARYEITRRCVGEGVAFDDMAALRVAGDTLMYQSEDGSVTWTRCPAGPEDE